MTMKTTLLFSCFFYLVSFTSFSQTSASVPPENNKKEELPLYNLYYLSKYIASNNLSSEEKTQVYSALIYAISKNKTDSYWLTSNNTETANKDIIKNFLDGIYVNTEEVKFQFLKGDFSMYNDFTFLNTDLEQIKNNYSLKLSIPKDTLDYRIKILDSVKIANDSTKMSYYIKKYKFLKEIRIDKKRSIGEIQTIINSYSDLSNTYSQNLKNYTEKIDKYATKYVEKYLSEYKVNIDTKSIVKLAGGQSDFSVYELNINSTIQSSEQRAASNTYKLPSESDMINAMAIFLAKRAQQETAIWFMDKIRENIKNPLVYEAFPETIKLIESLEDFKTPNFSVTWRYAIASDFVKMPKNLANSAWVQNFIFEGDSIKIENFSKAVTFGYDLNRLVAEKYNYRDIIRYFYTNPEYDIFKKDVDQKNNIKMMLRSSISILYILTNELFAIDEVEGKKNYRLLSYEEISGMTDTQWRTLGQLIQLKYGTENGAFDNFFKNEFNQQKQYLSKWVGNLLISLSQFDKVNKDFQKVLEKKENDPNYNFYNVWQNTLQIIDNLDYKKYFDTSTETNKDYIEILKQSITIYENIQNKNYTEAIQKTLAIIEKVSSIDKKNDNAESFDLILKSEKITFNKDGKSFTYKKENYTITIDSTNCLIISDDKNINYKFSHFNKTKYIFPFLNNYKNDNYDMIVAYDPKFKTNIDSLGKRLSINKMEILSLINYLGFHNGTGWDNQKLSEFIDVSSKNISKNHITNDKIERTKLKYQDKLLKITAFFGDVLVAKNAEELANVLDSHALPPTSYKLKRRVSRSIDLNGYVGLQGSRMWTNGFTSLKTQYTVGITAPIGFAYTWSTLKRDKPNNWGITIDLVDLGNIVNHYLVNSTNDYTKDVHFSEVFSPAASFMYALRKTPFVVFASFKLLPLKTSNVTTADGNQTLINEKAFDASVFSVGFKIDIPLVNLWSKVK